MLVHIYVCIVCVHIMYTYVHVFLSVHMSSVHEYVDGYKTNALKYACI